MGSGKKNKNVNPLTEFAVTFSTTNEQCNFRWKKVFIPPATLLGNHHIPHHLRQPERSRAPQNDRQC